MTTPAVLIIKRGSASPRDIELVRKAGVAVLVVKDPADVRYMDPPLAEVSRIEAICFRLVDKLISKDGYAITKDDAKTAIAQAIMQDERPRTADRITP